MIRNPARSGMERRRDQRGAVVVEAAIVLALFVIPMLLGVLTYGHRLWQAQKHGPYEPRIYASQVVGTFSTCVDLLSRVKSTVVNNISGLGVPIDPTWVNAVVVESDATGVLVEVTVSVPESGGSGDVAVLRSATRLDNVNLTSVTC